MLTTDGYSFDYRFYPTGQKGPSVIFIPGVGGRSSYAGADRHAYMLAPELNIAGFNFIGFDYYGKVYGGSLGSRHIFESMADRQSRGKSGMVFFPSQDGKESAADNIVRNEISALIEFLEKAPSHDQEKGIYLIGSSMGSFIPFVVKRYFPTKIKGIIFLSPGILAMNFEEGKKRNPDVYTYFNSLKKIIVGTPALAIGSQNDTLWPGYFKETTWDSAQLIRSEIGPNVELFESTAPAHGAILIEESKVVRAKIVAWLLYQNKK